MVWLAPVQSLAGVGAGNQSSHNAVATQFLLLQVEVMHACKLIRETAAGVGQGGDCL